MDNTSIDGMPDDIEDVDSNSTSCPNSLSIEEEVYYTNYGLIDMCDCCQDYYPIHYYQDRKNYITFTGKQFLCQKCL